MRRKKVWIWVSLVMGIFTPSHAEAFDYLEHGFFGDRACLEAQKRLRETLGKDETPLDLIAKYFALALACPTGWEEPYCHDDYKQSQAPLSSLGKPAHESGDYPLTFGDLSSLPDHLSQFGSVTGLGRASQPGLMGEILRLLGPEKEGPGGVIADVGEDACEVDGLVNWDEVMGDTDLENVDKLSSLPQKILLPGGWLPPSQGPSDPAGAYSFDNPHYLDLVLQNHHHFGDASHDSWLGLHLSAVGLMDRSCEEVLELDANALEDLSEGLDQFSQIHWDDLAEEKRRTLGCALLGVRLSEKVLGWSTRAESAMVEPVVKYLVYFELAKNHNAGSAHPLVQRTVQALMSVVFEALGLHFLQDSVAGGHLRVQRAAYGLGVARHLHDEDGRNGVIATVESRSGKRNFVAFGDGYLLGKAPTALGGNCSLNTRETFKPQHLTSCFIQYQRRLVISQSTASLLHWAKGAPETQHIPCEKDAINDFICEYLPIKPTEVAGRHDSNLGTFPQPPADFAFQSLATTLSLDAAGGGSQVGLRLVFLSSMGQMAGWLTSYHFGLLKSSRHYEEGVFGDEFILEFAYMFHWRWAARFLVNAGLYYSIGGQGLGKDSSFFMGLGPNVGLTFLPEGWTKIPLEMTLSYRVPLTFYNSRYGVSRRGVRLEAHWIEFAIGLAFM